MSTSAVSIRSCSRNFAASSRRRRAGSSPPGGSSTASRRPARCRHRRRCCASASTFIECRDSAQRQALVHLFFAEREARQIPGLPAELQPLPIRAAAVIGAGTMGGGIAMSLANAGIPVALLEASAAALERGMALIAPAMRPRWRAAARRASAPSARSGLIRGVERLPGAGGGRHHHRGGVRGPCGEARGVRPARPRCGAPCDPRHQHLDARHRHHRRHHLASATGGRARISSVPPHVMKLLENVRGRRTSAQTIATVMALGKTARQGRGARRQLRGLHRQPHAACSTGRKPNSCWKRARRPEQIDRVIEGFGFAMGPLAVRDLAGNDVGLCHPQGPQAARRMSAGRRSWNGWWREGRLGQKSGHGLLPLRGTHAHPGPAGDGAHRGGVARAGHRAAADTR